MVKEQILNIGDFVYIKPEQIPYLGEKYPFTSNTLYQITKMYGTGVAELSDIPCNLCAERFTLHKSAELVFNIF